MSVTHNTFPLATCDWAILNINWPCKLLKLHCTVLLVGNKISKAFFNLINFKNTIIFAFFSGHDQRSWSQNSKQGHVKQQPGQPQLPPVSASGQQQPPLPPGGPPLPPGEPPKPAQPPPPPMPPSSGDLRVTSMKPPKSIFDIDSPPASMPAPKSHNSQSSRHHGGHHQQPSAGHLIQQPPPPPITSSTLSQPKGKFF